MSEGLKHKYNVTRTDGKEIGFCFVLEVEKDPHARVALKAYAESCKEEYPELAADLNNLLNPREFMENPDPRGL